MGDRAVCPGGDLRGVLGTRSRARRAGDGLIGMLLVMLVIGFLMVKYMDVLFPAKTGKKSVEKVTREMPEEARRAMWSMMVMQINGSVTMFENTKSRKPVSLDELAATGLDTLSPDPWGGKYYLQKGWLRCTGNPNKYEKLWDQR